MLAQGGRADLRSGNGELSRSTPNLRPFPAYPQCCYRASRDEGIKIWSLTVSGPLAGIPKLHKLDPKLPFKTPWFLGFHVRTSGLSLMHTGTAFGRKSHQIRGIFGASGYAVAVSLSAHEADMRWLRSAAMLLASLSLLGPAERSPAWQADRRRERRLYGAAGRLIPRSLGRPRNRCAPARPIAGQSRKSSTGPAIRSSAAITKAKGRPDEVTFA